jgi:predicted DsbA family dithiol-disulfide isomerase
MAPIEVYGDIWCPFTHVALRWAVRRRGQLGRDDVTIRVRGWPLELVNGKPLDPTSTADHVDALRQQVAPDLFTHFAPEHFPTTTLPALALAHAAYRQDGRLGETVSVALRDALFEEGCDISRPEVLANLARLHGVTGFDADDDDPVRREWSEGRSRGVEGSPHFFCGDINVFCPSLEMAKDEEGDLHIRRDIGRLDRFLTDCLAESRDA